jgi:Tfp pilus assembly protein PilF
MPEVNLKLLFGLMVAAALGTGTVFAIHYVQGPRIASALLKQADIAETEAKIAETEAKIAEAHKHVERAERYLTRYLEFNPRDYEQKSRLAKMLAGETFEGRPKARRRALGLLNDVLAHQDNKDDKPDLRRLLVKVALELFEIKEARDHLKILWGGDEDKDWKQVKASSLPALERGELEGYWGLLLEFPNENKLARAIDFYRAAVDDAPNETSNYVRLAYLLRQVEVDNVQVRQARQEEADALVDKLVAKNDTSAQAYLSRWHYRRYFSLISPIGQKELGKLPLERDEWDVGLLGLTIARAGAAQDVVEAEKRAPQLPEVQLACAEKERMLNHRVKAREHLDAGLALVNRQGRRDAYQFQFLYHLANLHLDDAFDVKTEEPARQLAIQEATRRLEELRRTRLAPVACEFLEARLAFQEHKWGRAIELLEHVRPELSKQADMAITINLYLGQAYERIVAPLPSLDAFNRVLAIEPRSLPARMGRAWALLQQGKMDDADAEYSQLAAADNLPARIVLDIARVKVHRQLLRDPGERKWSECDAALTRADKVPEIAAEVAIQWAERYVGEGQDNYAQMQIGQQKAADVLRKALDAQPAKAPLLVSAQVELALGYKQVDEASTLLEAAQKKWGDKVEFRLARARIALARPESETRTRELAEAERGWDKLGPDDRAQLLDGLAQLYFRANNAREGRRFVRLLADQDRYQTDLKLRLLLFDLAARADNGLGDREGMRQALADIHRIERGQGEYYRYGQAVLLVWEGRQQETPAQRAPFLAEASKLLDEVASRRQTWAPVFLARAEVAELRGDWGSAIDQYNQAVLNGEQNPQVIERLVKLLKQLKRDPEAKLVTDRLKASQLINSELGNLASNIDITLDNPARAIDRVRQAVSADSNDVPLILEQANNQEELAARLKLSDPVAALSQERAARDNLFKAVRLAPKEGKVWLALVAFLNRHGETAEARVQMDKALNSVQPEGKLLTRALCLDALGDKDRGTAFEDAAKERPNDLVAVRALTNYYLRSGHLVEAEPLLRRIIARKDLPAREEDVQWARNTLAILLASGTDFERFREALHLVALELDANGKLLPEKDAYPPGTELLRTRARVLAVQPQKQFREHAIGLLESLGTQRVLTADDRFILARLHDQNGSWNKASEQYTFLATQSPNPPCLVAYIQALLRTNNLSEASRQIAQLEKLEDLNKVERGTFGSVDLNARWLEASGKGDKAIEQLREQCSKPRARAEDTLALIAALARQGKYDDSYKEALKAWDKGLPPESLGGVSVALLRDMKPQEPQIARFETLLHGAIAANPKKFVLRMHLADLYDLRGKYDLAIEQYRAILQPENEPNNIIALNNLAWLLAEHAEQGDEALRYINNAIAGVGRRADLLDTRGIIQLKRGKTADALADLKDAADEQATAVRLFHLARAYHEARDRPAAARTLKQACTEAKLTTTQLHPTEQLRCKNLLAEYQVTEYRAP